MAKDSILEILHRIESMQAELSAKLDKIDEHSSKLASLTSQANGLDAATALTSQANGLDADTAQWESDASRSAKTVLAVPEIAMEIEDEQRISTPHLFAKKQHTFEDDDTHIMKQPDFEDFHHAMGWKRQIENVFEAPEGADCMTRFAKGPFWALLSIVMILSNTAIIGIEIDAATSHHLQEALHREGRWPSPGDWNGSAFSVIEVLFLLWMIFELLVNLYAQRRDFILGSDRYWNIFDVAVVLTALVMQMYEFANVGFLRVVRLLRLGRMLRAFRVFKFFRGIRSMLISLSGSIMHLCSAMLLMAIFMYTVALVLMQGIASETEPGGVLEGNWDDTVTDTGDLTMFQTLDDGYTNLQHVYMLYGTVLRTMVTLFMTISGGLEWKLAAWPLMKLSWVYAAMWTLYITFMIFGMLNVLTGIFVDAAFQAMNGDRDNIIQAQLEERHSMINKIRAVFKQSDTDDSGQVTIDEFKNLLKNREMVAYLNAIGIDSSEAKGLFRLLDYDGSGEVSVDEFVTGFLRLKGGAKAVDMVMLLYENRKIIKKLNKIFQETKCANANISNMMSGEMFDLPSGQRSAWSVKARIDESR